MATIYEETQRLHRCGGAMRFPHFVEAVLRAAAALEPPPDALADKGAAAAAAVTAIETLLSRLKPLAAKDGAAEGATSSRDTNVELATPTTRSDDPVDV